MTTQTIPALERRLDLHASLDRVWRALTDSTELAAWFGTGAEFRPEPGAVGWFEWEDAGRFACRVEAVEPGRHLA